MTFPVTRRTFLATAAAGAAAIGLEEALAQVEEPAKPMRPNEQIGVGLIGCGGQGTHHLTKLARNPAVRVVGVCDIYVPRRERAQSISNAAGLRDYRRLLDRKDLDAVFIATPDHWHAKMAIDAMEAGKDVYVEKPMALHWQQARDIHRTAVRTKRIVQVGSQDCSREMWWKARDLIRQGRIGKLVWSQTSIARNLREGDWNGSIDLDVTPSILDWDAFVGPAEWRPYDPERFFRWRKYWDYSGGIATDLYVHVLHALSIAIGPEFPSRVVAGGGVYIHKDRETPDTFHAVIDYPSEHSVVIVGSQCNEQGLPVTIRGHHATMHLGGTGGEIVIRPERIAAGSEERIASKDVDDTIQAHHDNFFDCIRRRQQRTNCDAELGYKTDVAVDLAVESYRKDKVCRFDPVQEEVVA